MNKSLRILILVLALFFLLYNYFSKLTYSPKDISERLINLQRDPDKKGKPKIALIFDDLGESLKDIRDIHALKLPVTVAVIPDLKFSKNIAHIAHRCDFSVIIHLPLEPRDAEKFKTDKYTFINSSLPERKLLSLLRHYLNYVRVAIGVNTHMGSKATENAQLMTTMLGLIKERNFVFIDSRTSLNSVAYSLAKKMGVKAGQNQGFIDATTDKETMRKKIYELVEKAYELEKIIVIAHPKPQIIELLREELPKLKQKVEFITIKKYFNL